MAPSDGPLRIAIVVNELNVRGGTHKQVQRLADYLRRQGHACTVFTHAFDPSRCFPGVHNLTVREIRPPWIFARLGTSMVPMRMLRMLWRPMAMVRAIPKDVDVINLHDSALFVVAILVRVFRRRAKLVWQINDLPPYFAVGVHKGLRTGLSGKIERTIFRFASNCVSAITVNVGKNRERVSSQLKRNALLFHCGVDVREVERPARPPHTLPIQLVSTGVLFPHRNYEALLAVQTMLLEKHALSSEIRIVGATDSDPTYTKKIESLIRSGRHTAKLMGEVSERDLSLIYHSAHYFLFLNIDQSWGLAVFEAMNFGIPAIVSNSVGAVELLRDGVDCLMVDPVDSVGIAERIAKTWSDANERERLSLNAHQTVMEMSWDSMYSRRVEQLFYQLKT